MTTSSWFRAAPAATLLGLALLTSGCGSSAPKTVDYSVEGSRPNDPKVLIPVTQETGGSTDAVIGNDEVELDISHIADGYLSARYLGDAPKIKFQMSSGDSATYTYNLATDGSCCIFPLSNGNGDYLITVYTNVETTLYAECFSTKLHVELDDDFGPFLYPNQYCWFSPESAAVAQGELVCNPADSDLDAVSLVYNYVLQNISYDREEAETVQSGYLPDVDEVLETKKGICLDYASLMTAMLRTQGIPTRMEIGYAGSAYHAWVTCYIEEIGWVNGIIEFDGNSWSLMDPTLAASQGEKKLAKFVGDGSNYRTVYLY